MMTLWLQIFFCTCLCVDVLSHHCVCSAGCVEFGPDVTSSDKSVKVMLNAQDKVG